MANMASARTSGVFIATALFFGAAAGFAQGPPSRPVRLIVATSPGGTADFAARVLAQPLSERLGQQVVVENRAGAGGIIGNDLVAKAAPDGHTLLLGASSLAINPAVYKKLPYNSLSDFAPITQIVNQPLVLVVHPSLPARSAKELILLAKTRPNEIAFASAGTGSTLHLAVELLLQTTGARMLHVPYKGPGPAMIDLLAGRAQAMTAGTVIALPHVRSGRLRAIGVTSTKRVSVLGDVPTIAESAVPGYEAASWFGLLAPAGTSKETILRIYREVSEILRSQQIWQRFSAEGAEAVSSSPDDFATHLRAETAKWAKVVKNAGIQPE